MHIHMDELKMKQHMQQAYRDYASNYWHRNWTDKTLAMLEGVKIMAGEVI